MSHPSRVNSGQDKVTLKLISRDTNHALRFLGPFCHTGDPTSIIAAIGENMSIPEGEIGDQESQMAVKVSSGRDKHQGMHQGERGDVGATTAQSKTSAKEASTSTPVLMSITMTATVLTPNVGKYQQETITYTISGKGCAVVGITTHYYDESRHTGYQHAIEHINDHRDINKNSPLRIHSKSYYNCILQVYCKVLKSYISALERQVTEAVLIQMAGPDLLNSRGE